MSKTTTRAVLERGARIYEGSRIPSPIPTMLLVDPAEHALDEILTINFGPNHPSTHGVLRLVVDLDGEHMAGIAAVIGYLHTGFEKTMERKTWWKCITYPERIDYVSFQVNELAFVLAIEKLLELEVPEKATWMRMCMAELTRDALAPRLARHLGARARARSRSSGTRSTTATRRSTCSRWSPGRGCTRATSRPAASPRTSPRASSRRRASGAGRCRRRSTSTRRSSTATRSGCKRTKGIGLLSADDAIALGQSGPVLRASGVDWDLRRDMPYLAYDEVSFNVPVYPEGDVYARYKVHMDEMRQAVRIVSQCIDRLEEMRGEPWIADDRKVVLPPREELHTSMESLIHHFKIVTEGYTVPEGEVYVCVESPRGEFGVYVVSDGGPKPWRVKFRAPSFVALQATATCMTDAAVADMIAIVGSLDGVMGEVDR